MRELFKTVRAIGTGHGIAAYCSVDWPLELEIPTIRFAAILPYAGGMPFRAARGRVAEEGFRHRSARRHHSPIESVFRDTSDHKRICRFQRMTIIIGV